ARSRRAKPPRSGRWHQCWPLVGSDLAPGVAALAAQTQQPDRPPPRPVEAVFSALKRHYGLAHARYASIAGNAGRAFAALAMLNLLRARAALAR
ncbi:MAG TPA: hypothetical protein VJ779_03855, partial [Acetobacteraceae bacterium]|nr:hypothetical protein [Acetobacteraceae bacterium]